jgi:GDP-4-dehydro-6-deoxy-D-mannose reductase
MRVLITGAGGFVGYHLAEHLKTTSDELHGTVFTGGAERCHPVVKTHTLDLRDTDAVRELIDTVRPQRIYHLAAQAFVPRSFEAPWETLQNNIFSQLNVIKACVDQKRDPRILIVSSAEIYGPVTPDELPLTEQAALRPTSPYSVSKITQDMLALQYHLSHQLPIMRARPFNHIGPGQSDRFVAPAFALQVARIEAGQQEPVMRVGDLSARRDFTDVRDIVRAYAMILEHGQPGDVYNVASGQARSIQSLLDGLLAMTKTPITVETDPERLRPVSVPVLQGSCDHLHQTTGWKPQISFEQTLRDVLDDCRTRVQTTTAS